MSEHQNCHLTTRYFREIRPLVTGFQSEIWNRDLPNSKRNNSYWTIQVGGLSERYEPKLNSSDHFTARGKYTDRRMNKYNKHGRRRRITRGLTEKWTRQTCRETERNDYHEYGEYVYIINLRDGKMDTSNLWFSAHISDNECTDRWACNYTYR